MNRNLRRNSLLSLLFVLAWSLVVHTWKTAWVCVQLGYLPRMAEQNLTSFHQRINLKFGIKKQKTIRGKKKVHGKIRSTLNMYYIGRKMITRVYLLTTLYVIVVSKTSLILYVGTDNIFITEISSLYMTYIQYAPRTSIWILMSNSIWIWS